MFKYFRNVAGFGDGGETYNADHMSRVSVFTRDEKKKKVGAFSRTRVSGRNAIL